MNKIKEVLKIHPALSIIIGFQLFRIFLLPFMGLMPQDAYYHFYGENLSLSYFDHPAMIGYILRLFTSIFGKTVFVVKFADFFITSLTLISFYKLGSLFLSKPKLNNALILISTTVFITVISFNSTPDVPLLLCWTLSLICLSKAIFENKNKYWLLAGVFMGLAFDSKYIALLLQIGLLCFLVFSNKYRKLLLSPWVWASLIISALITFPVWYWNYQNEFASFLFQAANRTGNITKLELTPRYFFAAIAHQLLLLLPILFITFFILLYKHILKAINNFKLPSEKTLFLFSFFLPTFLGFFLLSPIYLVKLNWMMPSYITGILLAGMILKKKHLKTHVYISVGIHVLAGLQILFYLVPIKSDDTWVGWKELVIETEKLQEQYSDTFIFSEDGYKTTACMTFFSDQKIYAQNIIGLHALHFDYIGDDLSILKGKNALFIDSDKRFKDKAKKIVYPTELDVYFSKITELSPIIIKTNGKNSRKFWVYFCEDYQPKHE